MENIYYNFFMILNKKLPIQKQKIADWLKNNREKILNKSIVEVAKELDTFPSMITKTLKQIGYYGWKDYKAFVIGKILTPLNNNNYSNFYEKTFINRIKNAQGYMDSFDISKILQLLKTKRKIFFIASEDEVPVIKLYKPIFRAEGIKLSILVKDKDSLSLIEDNSIIFSSRYHDKTSKHIVKRINENNKNVENIVLVYGDLRKTTGAINIQLPDERATMLEPIITKLLHIKIIETIFDMIIIKYTNKRDNKLL